MQEKSSVLLNVMNISSSMIDNVIYVAFLWHMHQPYYKDPFKEIYRLPWVRLHGTKDYLDMVEILREFPSIKQVFNLTPSLLEQLKDYTDNNATDKYLELTIKRPSELDDEEKSFILENFFLANWDTMVRPFPRYYELLVKRGYRISKGDIKRIIKYFSDSDLLDLQVLFNLCWIDPLFRQKDPFLNELVKKGRNFTEDEKQLLISKQFTILNEIIPTYKDMADKGRIELTTSPYYHPILPLLCDTNNAKIATPDIRLPSRRFSHPEDAEKQVFMAVEYLENLFGYKPLGMWPSEGSVCEEVFRIVKKAGIEWLATDEDILAHSISKKLRDSSMNMISPESLYIPYNYEGVSVVFRDHVLSDLIGFVYSKWEPKTAASDFIKRILNIRNNLPKDKNYLVPIILDGENAWEYYQNDGHDFLKYLYEFLSEDNRIKTTTISEYIRNYDRGKKLSKIHAGSWINANYGIWIGHEEDNTAWDYLNDTREELEKYQQFNPEKKIDNAWKSIYIAEGSDWNWWYGDEHSSENQKDFDELFRLNLMNVYRIINKEIPHYLFIPILREDRSIKPTVNIRGFIEPKIDGIVTSYYEWYQGAYIDTKKFGGSMHKSESILSRIFYGFNKDNLFIRLDSNLNLLDLEDNIIFYINILKPKEYRIRINRKPQINAELYKKEATIWKKITTFVEIAIKDIIEIKIPFSFIEAQEKEEIFLNILIYQNSEEIERCPQRGNISITVPTPDFEAMMWY